MVDGNESSNVPMTRAHADIGRGQTPTPATVSQAFDDLIQARSTGEKATIFNKIYGIICTSTLVTILLALLNLFPLYLLIIGAVYYHKCPAQSYIPIFVIVEAIFFLVRTSGFWYNRWLNKKRNPTAPAYERATKPLHLNFIADLAMFVWLICGSVWVFGTSPNFEDPASSMYCNKVLYKSAYIYIILKWIAFPIVLLTGCCILASVTIANRRQHQQL